MFANLLAWANVALFGIVAIVQLWCVWKLHTPHRMIKLLYGCIGLYWMGLYLFVAFSEPGSYNAVLFGQVFIRPMFTLTAAVMAAAALWGYKTRGCGHGEHSR